MNLMKRVEKLEKFKDAEGIVYNEVEYNLFSSNKLLSGIIKTNGSLANPLSWNYFHINGVEFTKEEFDKWYNNEYFKKT